MNEKPFEVGDLVEIDPKYKGQITDAVRIITKIEWVGRGLSQSGWLVDARSPDPDITRLDLKGFDSDWFQKIK